MNRSLKEKLIRVERTINIYTKNVDEPLEEINIDHIEEINIDDIPFERLKEIVLPKEDDPLLYDGYELDENQISAINYYLQVRIVPDFKIYNYILVCGGIYDW